MEQGKREELIIIGAGGYGRELLQYVSDEGSFVVRGFLDDKSPEQLSLPAGYPVLGTVSGYAPRPGELFVLAVGEPASRAKIGRRFQEQGARFATIIHPRAYVASSATIGEGSVVAPFASVGAGATLGELTLVHFYASVAHDAKVGRFSALSPYSVVNGEGRLGEAVFMGSGAIVNPLKAVGHYSKVAAGAVVYQDVPEWSIAAGNPAKSRVLMRTA